MNILEIHGIVSKLPLDPTQKTRLAFLAGQAYTLEVLHEAFVRNGMNENSSIFYQAAKELNDKFQQIVGDADELGSIGEYFANLGTIFGSQVALKEARISYLD